MPSSERGSRRTPRPCNAGRHRAGFGRIALHAARVKHVPETQEVVLDPLPGRGKRERVPFPAVELLRRRRGDDAWRNWPPEHSWCSGKAKAASSAAARVRRARSGITTDRPWCSRRNANRHIGLPSRSRSPGLANDPSRVHFRSACPIGYCELSRCLVTCALASVRTFREQGFSQAEMHPFGNAAGVSVRRRLTLTPAVAHRTCIPHALPLDAPLEAAPRS